MQGHKREFKMFTYNVEKRLVVRRFIICLLQYKCYISANGERWGEHEGVMVVGFAELNIFKHPASDCNICLKLAYKSRWDYQILVT